MHFKDGAFRSVIREKIDELVGTKPPIVALLGSSLVQASVLRSALIEAPLKFLRFVSAKCIQPWLPLHTVVLAEVICFQQLLRSGKISSRPLLPENLHRKVCHQERLWLSRT
eukprot:s620_g7.t1